MELSKGSKAAADVAALLRARNPLIWITTREEGRTERLLMEAASAAQYEPRFWDCAGGVTDYAGDAQDGGAQLSDPAAVLAKIRDSRRRQVWILRDLPPWLRDPSVCRALRSLARNLTMAPRDEARAVILITPSGDIPPELSGHAVAVDWPLPDRSEIADILDAAIRALPEDMRDGAAPNGARDAAIDAAVGLTGEEAQACYARSLVTSRRIDPATVAGEKKRVIAKAQGLEWIDPLPGGLDAVGGLEALKAWAIARGAAFGPRARAYGLPAPKGALIIGVSGCGKSLTCKALATAWGVPLVRMDMGAMKSKFVGESEGNLRGALKVVDALGRCVLWLDEIEKAMAGATQGAADGGVSADALGTLLTWRQETASPVFVVATANNVEAIAQSNPELLRRFDATFFVDLPSATERVAILDAALRQYGRPALDYNIQIMGDVTADFTGAEIAALIPDALYAAFADGERELKMGDICEAARATVPLARTAAEKIEKLRAWAKGRARPASITSTAATASAARTLDI